MKTFFLATLCSISISLFGQKTLDTLAIDNMLLNSYPEADTALVDFKIVNILRSFDENFFQILGRHSIYVGGKYTILGERPIQIRRLTNKKEAMAIIICDTSITTPGLTFKGIWDKFNNDTTRFLSDIFVEDQFELHYPDFQYPQKYSDIKPASISQKIGLKNIIFYSKSLNRKIDSVAKVMKRADRLRLWNYLDRRYNDFWLSERRLSASSILITDITFGDHGLVYVGADIYGTHYLLTFNEGEGYKFESKRKLWVY